jgi:hypothetical protein
MRFWILIGLLLAGLAGYGQYWWFRDHALWSPPPAKLPAVNPVQPLSADAALSIAAALERPVLWSSRRPPVIRKQDDRVVDEINKSLLLAVLQSGDQLIALLRAPNGRLLKYSSQSQPWRLESFDGRQASFVTAEGQHATLALQSVPKR